MINIDYASEEEIEDIVKYTYYGTKTGPDTRVIDRESMVSRTP